MTTDDKQMDLILWRHAEAEDGLEDAARALTKRGHKQAAKIAKWLKERLPQGSEILSSPAKRTQQTAEALGLSFRTSAEVGTGASSADLLAAAGWPTRGGTVVVVGHQPTLGKAAALALTDKASDWQVKKGAVLWINYRSRGGQEETTLIAATIPDLV